MIIRKEYLEQLRQWQDEKIIKVKIGVYKNKNMINK